jgi:hypothetical protein
MKGALFYPWGWDWRRNPHPAPVSAGHLRGWWNRTLPEEGDHWVVVDRLRWLSPFRADADFVPLGRSQISELGHAHFQEARTALMLAEVKRDPVTCAWTESSRGLWVHADWPLKKV